MDQKILQDQLAKELIKRQPTLVAELEKSFYVLQDRISNIDERLRLLDEHFSKFLLNYNNYKVHMNKQITVVPDHTHTTSLPRNATPDDTYPVQSTPPTEINDTDFIQRLKELIQSCTEPIQKETPTHYNYSNEWEYIRVLDENGVEHTYGLDRTINAYRKVPPPR